MKRLWQWLRALLARVWAWWLRLGRGPRVALGGSLALVLLVGSVAGFKGYAYIEHDNHFCLSCHLMTDAFQRFARSAHSKIECHDCHKSSRVSQMWQLYATLVQKPSKVRKHAEVPNAVCSRCHESGDSVRWRQVQATAGHRVHFLSRDSALHGLQCVVCHGGTELHAFASVDQTCAKAGCHTNSRIHLGKMRDLSIYCATCHNFMAQSSAIALDSLGHALTPQARQCLSCHEMQHRLGQMEIALDPHRGVCGDCHNPHSQTTAAGAIKSCTDAACHTQVIMDTVTFHRGVRTDRRCATCHRPHSFKVEGSDCTRCHQNIQREAPSAQRAAGPPAAPVQLAAAAADWLTLPRQREAIRSAIGTGLPRFSHGDHRRERCASCHDSRERHGQLKIRSAADCQSCHHAGEARAACTSCHTAVRPQPVKPVTFNPAGGRTSVTRQIRFAHAAHPTVPCSRCHASTNDHAPTADCTGCHTEHHTSPTANCLGCHQGSDALLTHRVGDHANCATAACHGAKAANLPDARATCVVCHVRQASHQPGKTCNTCHQVRRA